MVRHGIQEAGAAKMFGTDSSTPRTQTARTSVVFRREKYIMWRHSSGLAGSIQTIEPVHGTVTGGEAGGQ
jgi:hypothetical protein